MIADLLLLLVEFFKTGLFAVGGGLATIPFLNDMATNHPTWFTHAELADMIAVSESTPGPIGVNMATYVGYRVMVQHGGVLTGLLGAFTTTLSLVLPSYVVICIISKILQKFSQSRTVEAAFSGVRPAVPGLILAAILPLFAVSVLSLPAASALGAIRWDALAIYAGVVVGFSVFKKAHPLIFIALGAAAGILLQMQ